TAMKTAKKTGAPHQTAVGMLLPHDGRELGLMLAGVKPLARFAREPGKAARFRQVEARFRPYVKSGALRRFVFKGDEFDRVYYCLPTEEWRVKLLELIDMALETGTHDFTIYDLQRIDGAMLGYSKEDVEFFVARWRKHHER